MPSELAEAIRRHQAAFELSLTDPQIAQLETYYDLVKANNPLLHLVGPCSPEEFAIRHVLESLMLLEHLPAKTRFADIGPGAGLPSIPCLLVREDLTAILIESKVKKAGFLSRAFDTLGLVDRAQLINRQFEEVDPGNATVVACRALDKFTDKLPRLLKWTRKRSLLLFGGNSMRESLQKSRVDFVQRLLPLSDQRFLFQIEQWSDL